MQSSSSVALRTILPPKSDSPSPGLSTTPAIPHEYADRAPARVPPSDAEAGAARSRHAQEEDGAVRGAACPLVVLVPRRRLAAGGARRRRGGARLPRTRAHRPRRRLRLAGVRP